ncbi:sensor histidine kinase [Sphingomicrobium sediminis]|uniref:histidine kinase n=1 Tax=Sphingomicrobium sediminis TaxID=2950949 RepID=A0A9X2ELJ9_9SPHN|nr:ATP-binding protein [Sphingomicrobium sediminis]MCM8557657.1 ATP-binding protein [Sphingomicrobium sediminis]
MIDPLPAALIDAFSDPVILVEGQRIIAINNAARDQLGLRLANSDIRLAIRHPDVLDAINSGDQRRLEVEGIGRADQPWRVIVTPVDEDITLVRMIDRAAERAAERMRVDFVANASHELRTPLAGILGYAETLSDDGPMDDETRRNFADTIESEARRMLRIVEDLMGLSRIEADRFVTPRQTLDLADLVNDTLEEIQPTAERRQCNIVSDVEANLPPVRGDQAQLMQLVDNLVGNAIRYGCDGECDSVRVGLARSGRDRIRLTVADKGPGIAPEHLPRLTERFYRVDPARSRSSGGTGLGLAIVKHIVERHRGTLNIASALGTGTTVTVDLPILR